MDLKEIVNEIYALPESAMLLFQKIVTEVSLPKGYTLMEADKVEDTLYFIRKGIARAYAYLENTEMTFWFGVEGSAMISMRSYIEHKSGYEYIELLEDCVLYQIKTSDLQQLYESNIHIANWGRKFAERELIKTETRMINREFKTAAERYQDLMDYYPHLLQRVQLGYIASFLGITQVSLSRIRADKR